MSMTTRGIGMTSQRTRDRLIERLQQHGISNPQVLEVMRSTPRHMFMDEAMASRAYEDTALPIGHGQTISQPYIVARMTELLFEAEPPQKVLEIGTGSGYQTAVLAQLVAEVFSVERINVLFNQARERLQALQLYNVQLRYADGYAGWAAHAPYDAILVTAAPQQIPEQLLEQLKVGGRMVIPTGGTDEQRLLLITRTAEQEYQQQQREWVSFVPLVKGIT